MFIFLRDAEQVKIKGKLTTTEYARICANGYGVLKDSQAGTSYKEVKEHYKNVVKVLNDIEPPEELRAYNNLQKKGIEYLFDKVDEQDSSIYASSDLFEAELKSELFAWMLSYNKDTAEVLQALTPTTQNILLEAGCIEESDIEGIET